MLTNICGGSLALIGLFSLMGCSALDSGSATRGTMPVPSGKGIVIGGIDPCRAQKAYKGPRYADGTVTVLRGGVALRKTGAGGLSPVFPTRRVGHVRVATNAKYRLVLARGQYALRAEVPRGSEAPFVQATVRVGKVVHVDIPNMCI